MLIQAAVAELTVEAFDEGVLCRLAGLDKVQLRAGLLRPRIQLASATDGLIPKNT